MILDFFYEERYTSYRVAEVVKLVDTRDLKSLGHHGCTGSSPVLGIKETTIVYVSFFSLYIIEVSTFSIYNRSFYI